MKRAVRPSSTAPSWYIRYAYGPRSDALVHLSIWWPGSRGRYGTSDPSPAHSFALRLSISRRYYMATGPVALRVTSSRHAAGRPYQCGHPLTTDPHCIVWRRGLGLLRSCLSGRRRCPSVVVRCGNKRSWTKRATIGPKRWRQNGPSSPRSSESSMRYGRGWWWTSRHVACGAIRRSIRRSRTASRCRGTRSGTQSSTPLLISSRKTSARVHALPLSGPRCGAHLSSLACPPSRRRPTPRRL